MNLSHHGRQKGKSVRIRTGFGIEYCTYHSQYHSSTAVEHRRSPVGVLGSKASVTGMAFYVVRYCGKEAAL